MPAILFDLDGTLTDPKVGITRSIQHALRALGAPCPTVDELEWCIGPPLHASFKTLLDTTSDERADEALAKYRERFQAVGMTENVMYDAVPAMLSQIREAGYRTFVATSKPHVFATQIIAHFGLDDYFDGIFGAELDGTRAEKDTLLSFVLATEGLNPADTVMIGDRKHDILGAAANGVPGIGVTYGYGTAAELTDAGAAVIVERPGEIPRAIAALLRHR